MFVRFKKQRQGGRQQEQSLLLEEDDDNSPMSIQRGDYGATAATSSSHADVNKQLAQHKKTRKERYERSESAYTQTHNSSIFSASTRSAGLSFLILVFGVALTAIAYICMRYAGAAVDALIGEGLDMDTDSCFAETANVLSIMPNTLLITNVCSDALSRLLQRRHIFNPMTNRDWAGETKVSGFVAKTVSTIGASGIVFFAFLAALATMTNAAEGGEDTFGIVGAGVTSALTNGAVTFLVTSDLYNYLASFKDTHKNHDQSNRDKLLNLYTLARGFIKQALTGTDSDKREAALEYIARDVFRQWYTQKYVTVLKQQLQAAEQQDKKHAVSQLQGKLIGVYRTNAKNQLQLLTSIYAILRYNGGATTTDNFFMDLRTGKSSWPYKLVSGLATINALFGTLPYFGAGEQAPQYLSGLVNAIKQHAPFFNFIFTTPHLIGSGAFLSNVGLNVVSSLGGVAAGSSMLSNVQEQGWRGLITTFLNGNIWVLVSGIIALTFTLLANTAFTFANTYIAYANPPLTDSDGDVSTLGDELFALFSVISTFIMTLFLGFRSLSGVANLGTETIRSAMARRDIETIARESEITTIGIEIDEISTPRFVLQGGQAFAYNKDISTTDTGTDDHAVAASSTTCHSDDDDDDDSSDSDRYPTIASSSTTDTGSELSSDDTLGPDYGAYCTTLEYNLRAVQRHSSTPLQALSGDDITTAAKDANRLAAEFLAFYTTIAELDPSHSAVFGSAANIARGRLADYFCKQLDGLTELTQSYPYAHIEEIYKAMRTTTAAYCEHCEVVGDTSDDEAPLIIDASGSGSAYGTWGFGHQ